MRAITVLGSTGSIGTSTLDVVARHPDRYSVHALTAHSSVQDLFEQCRRFRPVHAVLGSAEAASELQTLCRGEGLDVQVHYGTQALNSVASVDAV